ncbi:nuclear transport factor 2 family protein [Plastoroseomonas hellenica]|uniref:nuclear transport factor 2 family protein n=1 Tax=Plastoroseomonas hellenica TaxID=2687306 RepID=UPI001BA9AC07|nr:nuclear transport factor 2 family protein [Plastoroseomonas hellenica]MBR0641753.1 nuclear transport factor 2 family protein [Plastoroseomonas hellenica]
MMIRLRSIGVTAMLLLSQVLPASAAEAVGPDDLREIRAVFLRQAEAATAHDIGGIDAVLAHAAPGQPDPVSFIARAYRFWGREAVMEHFRAIFRGTWRFEPDQDAIRIVPLGADAAQIFAPTRVTLDVGGAPATQPFLVEEVAIRTTDGWRIAIIVPVPAQ